MNIETTDLKVVGILQFMPLKDQYIYYGVINGINGGYLGLGIPKRNGG